MGSYNYDYQYGFCHYFADIIINELRKLLPNNKINYYLILAERLDDNGEVIDDILVHVYIKIGEWLLDSNGFHKLELADIRLEEWEEYEETTTPDGYTYNTWIEESDRIPDYFFNSQFCNRGKIKKDITEFTSNPQFLKFIKKVKKKK